MKYFLEKKRDYVEELAKADYVEEKATQTCIESNDLARMS
jgi:hypothetical protein